MLGFFHHLLFPRESNNHRSKLLHNVSLLTLILTLFTVQFATSVIENKLPAVLGDAVSISVGDLLSLTNQKRQEAGQSTLVLNDQLSAAAAAKAAFMLEKDFWAHNSPDGTTPWVFIKNAGYTYYYAGENLARGFNSSGVVVDAWMASPSHKDNMLSDKYKDIGFAIVSGKLLGEDTVLVVEMFGSQSEPVLAQQQVLPPVVEQQPTVSVTPEVKKQAAPVVEIEQNTQPTSKAAQHREKPKPQLVASVNREPLFAKKDFSQIVVFILLLFIFVLLFDMIVVKRRKIARFVGHNLDHILYFVALLIVIFLFVQGGIL